MTENKLIMIEIDPDLCKGCGICIASCKFNVLRMSDKRGKQGYLIPEVAHPEDCTECMLCEFSCPDFAIEIKT